jgi:hypothetical protein
VKILPVLLALAFSAAAQAAPLEPICYQQPAGTGTFAVKVTVPGYHGLYWFCPKEALAWPLTVRVVWRDDYAFQLPEVPTTASLLDTVKAAWKANVQVDCREADKDPANEFFNICNAVKAAAQADPARPPVRSWFVQPYGALPDRAMFSSEDGLIAPTLTWKELKPRALVGAKCACDAVLIMRNSTAMCPIDPAVNAFAPCVQEKP